MKEVFKEAKAGHLTCTPQPCVCTARLPEFESREDSDESPIERGPFPNDRRAGRRLVMRTSELN